MVFYASAMDSGGFRSETDNRVPVLSDENMKDFCTCERLLQAHVLSTTGKDDEGTKRKLREIGPALYKNLMMMGNSISILMEQLDLRALAVEDGANLLLNHLRTTRLSDGKLAQLPRVFRSIYKEQARTR